MKKFLLPLIALFLFSGCMTLTNSRDTVIALRSSEPARFIVGNDTVSKREQHMALDLPSLYLNATPQQREGIAGVLADIDKGYLAVVEVQRSKKRLEVRVESDSDTVDFRMRSRISGAIAINLSPLLMGIDLAFNRSRNYHSQYIDMKMGSVASFTNPERLIPQLDYGRNMSKGNGYFTLGWPFATLMHYEGPRETTNIGGAIFGLSLGGEYYFMDKRSLGAEVSALHGFGWQVDVNMGLVLSHHHRKFSVGYGINFTHTWWDSDHWSDYDEYHYGGECGYGCGDNERTWAMGPIANAYYWPNSHFSVGVSYRPTLLRLGNTAAKSRAYGHNISFDLKFHLGGREKTFTARRKPGRF